MFCSSCGTENAAEAKFCGKCGSAVASTTATPAEVPAKGALTKATDEEIRARLKAFAKLTTKHIHCLECGYSGIVGLLSAKTSRKGWINSLVLISCSLVMFAIWFTMRWAILFWPAVIFTLIGLFVRQKEYVYQCPSCNSQLSQK